MERAECFVIINSHQTQGVAVQDGDKTEIDV